MATYIVCYIMWGYGYMRTPFTDMRLAYEFYYGLMDDPAVIVMDMEYALVR